MTPPPIISSKPLACGNASCDVAVIELLGPAEAEALAGQLNEEASAADMRPVRIISRTPIGDSVPKRRRRAIETSDATATFLIEDTTVMLPGWADALSGAFAEPRVAAVCGPVKIAPTLPARYRALGRLEYGRFDSTGAQYHLPGNAFAVRVLELEQTLAGDEGVIEHELERRLVLANREVSYIPNLRSVYAKIDVHGARLSTRFAHGRLYGANRKSNLAIGILKAGLAMPVLSLRALHAALVDRSGQNWVAEIPWILLMASAWALGELVGQLVGPGNCQRRWN